LDGQESDWSRPHDQYVIAEADLCQSDRMDGDAEWFKQCSGVITHTVWNRMK
jgi:hypothetical protein